MQDSWAPFGFSGTGTYETVKYTSTCDGDGYYSGKVEDTATDGYCAAVMPQTSPWASRSIHAVERHEEWLKAVVEVQGIERHLAARVGDCGGLPEWDRRYAEVAEPFRQELAVTHFTGDLHN